MQHRPDPDSVVRQRDEIREALAEDVSDVVPAAPEPVTDDVGPEPANPGPDPQVHRDEAATDNRGGQGAPPAEPAASATRDPLEASPVNRDR